MSWIRRNFVMKSASVGIALFLFGYVQYSYNVTRRVNVRVEMTPLPDNLLLSQRVPSFIEVSFRGSRDLMDFETSTFRVLLRNSKPEPGPNVYQAYLIPEPPENISASYTKRVTVYLDESMTRELPVVADLAPNLANNLQIGYVSVRPQTVRLRGPLTTLATMDRISTTEVAFESSVETQFDKSRLLLANLPPFVAPALGQGSDVDVKVQVLSENWIDRPDLVKFEQLPVRCSNEIPGLRMKVVGEETVDVYVTGSPDSLRRDQFQARVFCPVFFDERDRSVKPGFLIKDLPVRIIDRLNRSNVPVRNVVPARVDLQFEKVEPRISPEERQGLEEHLLP